MMDAKLMVDIATGVMDEIGMMADFGERRTTLFCAKLEAAFKEAAAGAPDLRSAVVPTVPHGYWRDGEWYGFSPGENPDCAEGQTFDLTPVWTHGHDVTFRCVALPDSDDFDYVPHTPEDAALLERFVDLASAAPVEAAALTDQNIIDDADDNDSGRTARGYRLFSDVALLRFARAIEARIKGQPAGSAT